MPTPPSNVVSPHAGGIAFSFPFRFTPYGSVAAVDPGSDQEVDEHVAVLCLTAARERMIEPDYRILDPE